jgi:hypothetical protein
MASFAGSDADPDACFAVTAAPRPESPCRHYSLKLNPLVIPESQSAGWSQKSGLFLKARIDGGPVIRLLLDSGARNIVLDKRTATLLGRSSGSAYELVGFGSDAKAAKRVASGTVAIGDLILRDCAVLAVDGKLIEGIDGVIPLALFADFLVRLDLPRKTLELDPYPGASPPAVGENAYTPARASNDLLFLPGSLNESQAGYVLLDTGAAWNAVASTTARVYRMLASRLSLIGAGGDTDGYLLPPGVRFRFGSRVVAADPAVVVDLSALASHHRFAIAGVLGYPALRRSILTIDYRDTLVRIDGK